MRLVFFPEELHQRAPDAVGHFCAIPGNEWLTLAHVVEAIKSGEPVSIRPASDSELRRAEAYIAMFEIGAMMAEKMGTLLDQDPAEVANAKIFAFGDYLKADATTFPGLLDIDDVSPRTDAVSRSYASADAYSAASYAYGQHGQG